MKKIVPAATIITIIIFILLFSALAVFAAGSAGNSGKTDIGDKVSLFKGIQIRNPVSGNVVSLFGDIDINGDIDGNVITIFGSVNVKAGVTGNVTAVFGNVVFSKGSRINGNSVSIGSVKAAGRINGDVVTVMGDVTVEGSISGGLVDILGNTVLTGRAHIDGDLLSIGELKKATGAVVGGSENSYGIGALSFTTTAFMALMIIFAVFVIFLGLPLLIILRGRSGVIWEGIGERTGRRILLGLVLFMVLAVVSTVLCILVVVPLLYFILMVLAETVAAVYLGRVMFNIRRSIFISFAAGFAAITLVKGALIFFLPQIGFVFGGLTYIAFDIFINSIGFGILADTRFGTALEFK